MYFISNLARFQITTICLPLYTAKDFEWSEFDEWEAHNAVVAGWGYTKLTFNGFEYDGNYCIPCWMGC